MKFSARNAFTGKITDINQGPISTEVTIRVAKGVEIVSVITTNSAKRLKLKVGNDATAIIKADNVIVATK
jgi:molybdopterin-binding protein